MTNKKNNQNRKIEMPTHYFVFKLSLVVYLQSNKFALLGKSNSNKTNKKKEEE